MLAPVPLQCPWSGFAQQIDPMSFCEARVCGWIVEPSNTWTNIGYLIAAILIYRSAKYPDQTRKLFYRATLLLFFGSTLFHATGTVFGKLADFSSMFVLAVGVLSLALRRSSLLSEKGANYFFVVGSLASIVFLFVVRVGKGLFAVQVAVVIVTEIYIYLRRGSALSFKYFGLSFLCLVTAFVFWNLDIRHVACNPENHILTAHGIWHLLCATSIYLLFLSCPTKVE